MFTAKKILSSASFLTALLAMAPLSSAQVTEKSQSTAMNDQKFLESILLEKIHLINGAEVKVGDLGITKAKSASARKYAEMLVKDHTAADNMVKATAKRDGITLEGNKVRNDASVKELKAKLDKMYAELNSKSKDDFDRAFSAAMVSGHQDAIDMITADAKPLIATNSNLKKLIDELLPSLTHHKQMAEGIKLADK